MLHPKIGDRAKYRQQEGQRIKDSVSLSDRYPQLSSLTVELAYYGPDGAGKSSQIKYVVNIAHARSVFSFSCPNNECIRGDFDLSAALASAVAAQRATVTGELCCPGWRSRTTIDSVRCNNVLRYTFSLGYSERTPGQVEVDDPERVACP